jgi:hypothetical protein
MAQWNDASRAHLCARFSCVENKFLAVEEEDLDFETGTPVGSIALTNKPGLYCMPDVSGVPRSALKKRLSAITIGCQVAATEADYFGVAKLRPLDRLALSLCCNSNLCLWFAVAFINDMNLQGVKPGSTSTGR